MFENLGDRLQSVMDKIKGYGKITEDNISEMTREIRLALLEADVNYTVVKEFIANVKQKALGEEVAKSLKPGEMFVKIVKDELVELLGGEKKDLNTVGNPATLMLVGLQGSGKTTTAAKLAYIMKNKLNKKVLLAACDVYRPAAIKQLQVNGEKQGVPVFTMGDQHKPVDIVKAALEHAAKNGNNIVIIDTAGRLHIDQEMMDELVEIRDNVTLNNTILTVDAMTGQDAVNVANSFNDQIGIDGVILTKLDGDTRGGAALSIRAVTGKPILFIGMGEKLEDLEQFYPDRMASRILGMGDIESLIEKAQHAIDEDAAAKLEEKMKSKQGFGFDDYLIAMEQMNQMGGITSMLSMMPGMGSQLKGVDVDDSVMDRPKAIILSMTPEERSNPNIISPSRKRRIAKGAGVDVSEVNRMMKQFEQTRKMMKQMGLMGNGKGSKKKRRGGMMSGLGGMPNMGGFPGLGGGKKFPF